jgi:multidrug transporter EmrE-like cation transporter
VNYKFATLNVIFYSFVSGLLACFVSLFIKLAFNISDYVPLDTATTTTGYYLRICVQIVFVATSFLLNSLMWLFYTKSLNLSANTLFATALNKFSNFICSAVFGFLLFKEELNVTRWLFGLFLLLIGILILNDQQQSKQQEQGQEQQRPHRQVPPHGKHE